MTYPISEIEGLPAFAANKLKAQGIRTTDALLEAASTVKGRKALSAKTGISEQQLLEWANVSDYMRIPGMGRAKVGLVRAAGVTTVRELAYRNPARLAQSMREANDRRRSSSASCPRRSRSATSSPRRRSCRRRLRIRRLSRHTSLQR